MDILDKLKMMRLSELKMSYVEYHTSRLMFIDAVIKRIGIDPNFDALVKTQLDLFCGDYLDPRTFVVTCNDPKHKIRNALIAWNIDHP